MDGALYREVVDRIRSSGVDVLINLTTGPGARFAPGADDPLKPGPATNMKLPGQRVEHILELLRRTGQIVAKDVSRELSLSEDTIRRDLRELAAEGLLQRVHGGALPSSPATGDFAARLLRHREHA